ncbi:uncharacterized protein LOC119338059 isoform X1 [Triticum dicoccoides]|uniref:uncharacterized protein LOC119338059 isoform X1 n=1 Tax=Triticum dicoccoides TaxID=85692 RepID=UPI00188FEBB3|nr:uncharacterized protein LOC119338059 isoform X1 [Triticum dicoccoides]
MIGSECMQALHFVSNADYILVNGSIRMRDSLAHIRVYSMRCVTEKSIYGFPSVLGDFYFLFLCDEYLVILQYCYKVQRHHPALPHLHCIYVYLDLQKRARPPTPTPSFLTGRRIYAGETWPYGTGLIISCPGAIISCSKQPRRAAECSTIQELYQLRYGNHCRILQQLMHLASCMFCPLRADHPACTGRSWSSVQKLEVV